MGKAPPVHRSQEVPIATPPARVEFSKTAISNFPLKMDAMKQEVRAEVVIERTVLTTTRCWTTP